MKPFLRTLSGTSAACAVFLMIISAAQRMQCQPRSSLAEVQVDSVELSDINPDSIEATVRISGHANESVRVRTLMFEGVTIDGVRVHVPPLVGPFQLRMGRPIDDLPDLRAVITYKELESLEPLRRAIREGHATIHADVRAELVLNLFQKLMLLSSGAWVNLAVDQQVAVEVPGGFIGRTAAFGALLAAEPVWIAGQAARDWRQSRSGLTARVRSEIRGRLVALETTYELSSREGEHVAMHKSTMGFLIGNGQFAAPAESLEPWAFDDALSQALDRGDVTLDENKVEVTASLLPDGLGVEHTFSLHRKEIRVVRNLRVAETAISIATKRRYHIRFRQDNANAVMYEIPSLSNSGRGLELANEPGGDGGWQMAAVVRLNRRGSEIRPTIWLTEARIEEGRYHIKDLVDPSAAGSPVWVDGGVVGLLQDEGSAAEIKGVLKRLR